MTVAGTLEVDTALGTSAAQIADFAQAQGVTLGAEIWCGDVRIDRGHPAGVWPLLAGASIGPQPGLPCAPTEGLSLLTIAGPDVGSFVPLRDGAVGVGRAPQSPNPESAFLAIADPHMSKRHFEFMASRDLTVRDSGSTNGTYIWRGAIRTRAARSQPALPGDVLQAGASWLAVVDPHSQQEDGALGPDPSGGGPSRANPEAPLPDLANRLAPLVGSLAMGVMMAATTGRWWFAVLGLAYPAYALAPAVRARLARSSLPPNFAITPSDLPQSRDFWGTAARGNIAIEGPADAATAFARAVVLSRGRKTPPGSWAEPWMDWLEDPLASDGHVTLVGNDAAPSWCDTVVAVSPRGTRIHHDGTVFEAPVVAVSLGVAESWARRKAGSRARRALPAQVRWGDLSSGEPPSPSPVGAPRKLAAPVGVSESGAFMLDLDEHGPHLLVAGTTGAGKSACLETLVLSLARRYSPADLAIAVFDFKGGAGLGSCRDLPHSAGTLTDLDGHLARRALAALSHELTDRKAALVKAGHASLAEWEAAGAAPPRLLVVADEYQELTVSYPEFLPDLARLAAQGRSLGLHLVLATQRPAGAVTPEIRANIGTTIALRVNSDAESRDLVGTSDAASIPRTFPGRAIIATGEARTIVQMALPVLDPTPPVTNAHAPRSAGSADHLADAIRAAHSTQTAQPLWLAPLPPSLPLESEAPPLATGALWLGRGDVPAARRQPALHWEFARGAIVIAGPPGSGRTSALRLLGAQAKSSGLRPVWLPADPREAARTIALVGDDREVLLLVDDADRALADLLGVDHGRGAEALGKRVTSAPIALAVPVTGSLRIASQATTRVILAGATPTDDAVWGVPRNLHGTQPQPGRARVGIGNSWCEAQVGWTDHAADQPVVQSLPSTVNSALLEGLEPGSLVVGIGGDHAEPWVIDPARAVLVIGAASAERDRVHASLVASCAARKDGPSVNVVDNPLLASRRDLDQATMVLAEPSTRTVRDAFRGDSDGLVDARPPTLRVLMVQAGVPAAVQLSVAPLD